MDWFNVLIGIDSSSRVPFKKNTKNIQANGTVAAQHTLLSVKQAQMSAELFILYLSWASALWQHKKIVRCQCIFHILIGKEQLHA